MHRPRRFAQLVVLATVMGTLLAALVLPVVAGVGLGVRAASRGFSELPAELATPPLPEASKILAADGSVLATFYDQNRVVVPLAAISPVMRQAIVAIEDSRFYQHGGIDIRGTLRAFVANQSGSAVQGGSTLTQQYVKNVLVEQATIDGDPQAAQAAMARSYLRKLRELRYAIGLEQRLTKDQILQRYLNIAYFGDGSYGVEAAARHYFGVHAADLSVSQAATLAGIVAYPSAYDPLAHPDASRARRNVVLARMAQLGYLTGTQATAAMAIPIGVHPTATPNGCATALAPYFCDYVLNVVRNDPAFGPTVTDRVRLLLDGGLTIRTTLDVRIQQAAARAVDQAVPTRDPSGLGAAIAMVTPGTGAIVAMAQNRTWGTDAARGQTMVSYAADAAYGGSNGFQPGSTFKIFTLASALTQGIGLGTRILSPATRTFTGFTSCTNGAPFPPYTVSNSTGSGTFDLRTATWRSVNTYFVALEQRTGICAPARLAQAMGVTTATGAPLPPVPSLVLGSADVSPLVMANAYATFAAHGRYCPARAITSVTDRNGRLIPLPAPTCTQVLPATVADTVTSVLAGVIDGPDPGRTGARMSLGRPAAGKTGTTDNNYDVWFDGYTPELAAAVWVGDPGRVVDGVVTRIPLRSVTVNGRYYPEVFGLSLPGPIWRQAMGDALASTPITAFAAPDPATVRGRSVLVPDLTGLAADQAVARLTARGLVPSLAANPVPATAPAGTVARTQPAAGAVAYAGSPVVVYLSDGSSPTPSPAPSRTDATPTPSGTPAPDATPTPSGSPAPLAPRVSGPAGP